MAESAPQPKTSSGLAIAGLVLGIIAILTSFLPIINNLSFFIALIGGVLAVIALVGALRGKHTAKGMSIAGVVLAVVSIVVVLVTQSAYSAALKAASDELSSDSKPAAASSESASSSDSSKKSEEKADDGSASEATPAEEKAEEAADSKYAVTIDAATVGTDYSDNPCVFITYTFTNVSDDDASSFIASVNADVYQDGVECDSAFADTDGGGNSMTKVKKGSSIEVVQAYELQNTTSDVEVEVKELFSWDDVKLATRTFQIA